MMDRIDRPIAIRGCQLCAAHVGARNAPICLDFLEGFSSSPNPCRFFRVWRQLSKTLARIGKRSGLSIVIVLTLIRRHGRDNHDRKE